MLTFDYDKHALSVSDLVGRRGASTGCAEVKGTTGGGERVLVTAGEVWRATEHRQECALVVVSGIEVAAGRDEVWIALAGRLRSSSLGCREMTS